MEQNTTKLDIRTVRIRIIGTTPLLCCNRPFDPRRNPCIKVYQPDDHQVVRNKRGQQRD